ncbi:hypothetical protein CLU79DRAFT_723809 [Phycomyces nitens]|nr:hypothetical protein CLU79DRAFT_723809 [Phycomyces nitens]
MKASWPRSSCCWLLAFALVWIFGFVSHAFPVPLSSAVDPPYAANKPFNIQSPQVLNNIQLDTAKDYRVDVSHFSHLLTTHLLFEHLENAYLLVSKKISLFFQDTIQLTAKLPEQLVINSSSSVDVQILKHQLRNAVAAYIEDRVPAMWNMHASALDKTSLQSFIEYSVVQLCPAKDNYNQDVIINSMDDGQEDPQYSNYLDQRQTDAEIVLTVSSVCLNDNSAQLLSALETFIGKHIRQAMSDMVSSNLPYLYNATRAQVKGILAHFNSYILVSSGTQLELNLSPEDGVSRDYSWLFQPSTIDEILTTVTHWANEDTGETEKDPSSQNMLLHSVKSFADFAQYS